MFDGDIFFFKQKTAYEMRISDWSSDVCSSDLYDFTLCCGCQAPRGAREQRKTECAFDFCQRLAQGGLRQAECLGGGPQAAPALHFCQQAQVAKAQPGYQVGRFARFVPG